MGMEGQKSGGRNVLMDEEGDGFLYIYFIRRVDYTPSSLSLSVQCVLGLSTATRIGMTP